MTSGSGGTLWLIAALILMEITPGRSRKRGGGAAKRVKATLAEYTKMIAHKGIFVLSKRGLCFRTMAYLLCQCVSPYFKFIAYKLPLETVRDRNASHSAPQKALKPIPSHVPLTPLTHRNMWEEEMHGFLFRILISAGKKKEKKEREKKSHCDMSAVI